MSELALPIWSTVITVILMGSATYTDLRWRRIPNYLTFPALGLGVLIHLLGGWGGLLLSVTGAVLAPSILYLVHTGKGLGMGDIKLAMAVGALLGAPLAVAAMLVSMIVGGGLAVVWMLKEVGAFGHGRVLSILGRFLPPKTTDGGSRREESPKDVSAMAIPYGLALSVGTLATLVVCLWTGKENWFLWSGIVEAMR